MGAKTAAYGELFSDCATKMASHDKLDTYFTNQYDDEDKLSDALGTHGVAFAERPLENLGGFQYDNQYLSDHDLSIYHEEVVHKEAGKIIGVGYSPKGIHEEVITNRNIKQYRFSEVYHNIHINSAAFSPAGFGGNNYNFIRRNCQDYVDRVRDNLGIG